MPGTGGFRKVRWEDAPCGKGKGGRTEDHLLLPHGRSPDLVRHSLWQG
jgi:hypothetical protein